MQIQPSLLTLLTAALIASLSAPSLFADDPHKGYIYVIQKSEKETPYAVTVDSTNSNGAIFQINDTAGKKHFLSESLIKAKCPPAPDLYKSYSKEEASSFAGKAHDALQILPDNSALKSIHKAWKEEAEKLDKGLIKKNGEWVDPVALREEAFQKEFEQFSEKTIDPQKTYSPKEIGEILKEGKNLISKYSDKEEKISSILESWQEELRHVLAGDTKMPDGKWLTAQEIIQKEEEEAKKKAAERKAFWNEQDSFTLSQTLMEGSQLTLPVALIAAVPILLILPILGFFFAPVGKGSSIDLLLAIAAGGSLLGILAFGLLFYDDPHIPSLGEETRGREILEKISYQLIHQENPSNKKIPLTWTDINTFLHERVRIVPSKEEAFPLDLTRQQITFYGDDRAFNWIEKFTISGVPLAMTLRFPYTVENNTLTISPCEVSIGSISLGGAASQQVWNQVGPEITEILKKLAIFNDFKPTYIGSQKVLLSMDLTKSQKE